MPLRSGGRQHGGEEEIRGLRTDFKLGLEGSCGVGRARHRKKGTRGPPQQVRHGAVKGDPPLGQLTGQCCLEPESSVGEGWG